MAGFLDKINNINKKKLLFIFFVFSFLVRLLSIIFFADLNHPEMWEFGKLARSLYSGIGYCYPSFTTMVPSAHMPPGLPFIYCIFFTIFGDNSPAYAGILVLNSLIMSGAVVISYLIAENVYNKQTAFLTALYVSISPIYLYATISFNSIVYYFLLINLCYFYFLKIQASLSAAETKRNSRVKSILLNPALLLGTTLGVFLYFRAEMLILIIFLFSYFMLKKKYQTALLIIAVSFIFILPWTIRNYTVFGKIIPVSTSGGMNFYYGHSDEKYDVILNERLFALKEDNTFETNKSDIAYNLAFDYIKNNQGTEIKESISKLWSFWVIDKYRDMSKNPLYLLIWLPTLLFFIIGFVVSMRDKLIRDKLFFVNVMIFISTAVVLVFFNIPRYQIQLSYLLIPTAIYGVYSVFRKFFLQNYNTINKS
jgi:hypothetical protein